MKYELVKDDIKFLDSGEILYRIKALKDFNGVKIGDLGGYIESEGNLSHDGDCWVYDDSIVYGGATVSENASIRKNSIVAGEYQGIKYAYPGQLRTTEVYGNAEIYNSIVCWDAHVYGELSLYEETIASCTNISSGSDFLLFGNGAIAFKGAGPLPKDTVLLNNETIWLEDGYSLGLVSEELYYIASAYFYPEHSHEYIRFAAQMYKDKIGAVSKVYTSSTNRRLEVASSLINRLADDELELAIDYLESLGEYLQTQRTMRG